MTLITYDDNQQGGNKYNWIETVNYVVTIIQLVISCIVFIFCAIERFPISIHALYLDVSIDKIVKLKQQAGFTDALQGAITS